MLDMVLRSMVYLPLVNANLTVAVDAPDVSCRTRHDL
jgi:hypothetical protein